MAAGNPIYAALVTFQNVCPPWNVTSITMWLRGFNRSAAGGIRIGPTPVDFQACSYSNPIRGQALVTSLFTNGSIVFYSSGYMPVIAELTVTHTGGWRNMFSAPPGSADVWALPIGPSDALSNYYGLKLLGVSIIVGSALTGWLPSIHALEQHWRRWRNG
jgi:hypothetical protein